jgi:hypothetical protein
MGHSKLLAVLAAAVVLAGAVVLGTAAPAAAAKPSEWQQVNADAGGTGYQPNTGGLHAGNADRLGWSWARETAAVGAAVAGGALYVASTNGVVRRLDPITGATKATVVNAPNRRFHQLAVVGATIFVRGTDVAGTNSYVAAYRSDGGRRWEYRLPAGTQETIDFTIGGGRLAVVTGTDCAGPCTYTLHVLRTDSGVRAWSEPVGGEAHYPPAIVGGTLYLWAWRSLVGSQTTAYDLLSGGIEWTVKAGSRPTTWSGALYTGGPSGVCSWVPDTGANRWCRDGAASNTTNLALGPAAIYSTQDEQQRVMAHSRTGTRRWVASVASGYDSADVKAPLVTGGGVVYVYVEHFEVVDKELAEVQMFRADSGAFIGRLNVPGPPDGPVRLVLAAGHLFVLSDLRIDAFRPTT